MAVQAIPDGYPLCAYLAVDDARRAIEYYAQAFGAQETARMEAPGDQFWGDRMGTISDPFGHV